MGRLRNPQRRLHVDHVLGSTAYPVLRYLAWLRSGMLSDRWTRPKTVWVAAASICIVTLFAVACSTDTSDSSPVTEDAALDSAEGAGFSVESSLAQIPLSAVDDATSSLQIFVGDLDAAADQARLRRPANPSDPDQLADFIRPLAGLPTDGRPPRMFVRLPQVLSDGSIIQVEDFDAELGFSPGDVTSFVALESPPGQFVVLGGVTANPDLPTTANGVQTAGEGADFEIDIAGRTVARPLGRPLRIAERDGLVAMSLATNPVLEWLNNTSEATLADEPVLAALAGRLDEQDVVAATLFALDSASFVDQTFTEPLYRGVGLGWAADDSPRGVAVFTYESADAAQQQLATIEARFEGESLGSTGPMSELVTLDGIAVRGSEIVANVSFPSESLPSVLYNLFIRLDGPFALTPA